MAWEKMTSLKRGRLGTYGPDWRALPSIAVNKSGISFNGPAVEMFGLIPGKRIDVLYDSESRKLGFRLVGIKEPVEGSFVLSNVKVGVKSQQVTKISVQRFIKRIPDCIGHAFRLFLNSKTGIIEAGLATDNMLRKY